MKLQTRRIPLFSTSLIVMLLFGRLAYGADVEIEAENGTLGAEFDPAISDSDASGGEYITVVPDGAGDFPESADRVVTYDVTFTETGTYDLWARLYIGPDGGSDDSFFYGGGFGERNVTDDADWIEVNGIIDVDGITSNEYFWINLSGETGIYGDGGTDFTVTSGDLEKTFQIGGREDGLRIDKLVFSDSAGSLLGWEAESGNLGDHFDPPLSDANASNGRYITTETDEAGESPGSDDTVATYDVTFTETGTYDLWARLYIGPDGGGDDSFFYGSGFGERNVTDGAHWFDVNGIINVDGITSNEYFWINLSDETGEFGESGRDFTVTPGDLNQTFQIGGREDGLRIDALAFGDASVTYTEEQLDQAVLDSLPKGTMISIH